MNRERKNQGSIDAGPQSRLAADPMQVARLGASVFAVLMAYYLLKPAREALLATAGIDLSGAELRGLATVGQGFVAVVLAAGYSFMADRLTRSRLVVGVNGTFAVWLGLLALRPRLPWLPAHAGDVVVYVVTGAVGVVIIAQLWAFVADIEGRRAGRLLPILSLVASAGGVAGAFAARAAVEHLSNPVQVLFLGAAVSLCVAAAFAVEAERHGSHHGVPSAAVNSDDAAQGTMDLVLGHRYLLGTAMVTLVAQWVGTNGENLMFGYVQSTLGAGGIAGITTGADVAHGTMAFYASFSLWSNLAAMALQAFVAYGCVRGRSGRNLLLVLPVVTLASATAMIFVPAMSLVKCLKVVENATRYSINNTASQLLWLPTSAAMKYKAKIIIETVVVRLADVLAALTAFVGMRLLGAPLQEMYLFNALLVVIWAFAAAALVREQSRRLQATAEVVALPVRTGAPAHELGFDLAA